MKTFYSLYTREGIRRTLVTNNILTDRLQRNHRNLICEIGTARKAAPPHTPASTNPWHRLPSLRPAIRKLRGTLKVANLTEFEGGRVVVQQEGRFSFRDVAGRLGRNVCTVHNCWQQWSREGTASRRPYSGQPRGTTAREDRRVRRMTVAHRTASAAEIRAAVGTTVTQRTVTNLLLPGQLRARRPVACIPLTPNHCRLRSEWCQAGARWRTEWRSVVFSDESRFCLGDSDGRVLVRMRLGERLQPTCLRPRHTGPTPGVMVWGAISYESKRTLVVTPRALTDNFIRQSGDIACRAAI
ncbi:hypothetical protein AVEN_134150-1 [Araneus ventricosus]|uniref:Transposase Tc1-like domain-containing protein n=1 Tax=Araneus ventricosus TaxID=182803 RepID=A0A4Y2JFN0_ARAVE|nr:hypothetical protein AVEN_134150-1 [Araneus ventricosus]